MEWIHILFISNDGNPLEPCHIHVRKGERIAKFWVEPDVCLASSYQMTAKELNLLEKIVMGNTKPAEPENNYHRATENTENKT